MLGHQGRFCRARAIAFAVLTLVAHGTARADCDDETSRRDCSWTALVMFENDLFSGEDEQYTSGVKFGWISPDLTRYRDSENLPTWLLPVVRRLPLINEPGIERNVEFYFGQKIFTPEDTQTRTLVEDDRPYAGWLYAGVGLHNKNEYVLDAFHLQFGVTGKPSLAERTQNFIHKVRNLRTIKGWDNQLGFEPGFVAYYERKWRALRGQTAQGFGYDLIGHAGAAAGNVYVYGVGGAEFRLGLNIPRDFGVSLIRPGGDSNAPALPNGAGGTDAFGLYAFTALSGRVVGRDLFLDGNTFEDSHSIEKKHVVGDLILGLALRYQGVKISYAQVFRSREFKAQRDPHQFGSISVSYTF